EKADEAVILEGTAEEITDRSVWKQLAKIYNSKYGGDVEPLLMAANGCVFRVQPQVVFAQDEHAENFADAVTRWRFDENRSEEHTSELQSRGHLVCRLPLEKKKTLSAVC